MVTKISSIDNFLKIVSFEQSDWYDYGANYTVYLNYIDNDLNYKIPFKLFPNEVEIYNNIKRKKNNQQSQLFSLGNEEYYKFLSSILTYEVKCEWLTLVNDIAYNTELFFKMKTLIPEDSIRSFLRGFNDNYIEHTLKKLATQTEDERVIPKITLRLLNTFDDETSVIFNSEQFPNLPSNTYAIIGKNGSGKTRLLNSLVLNHLRNSREGFYFSERVDQMLYISFSPFDYRDYIIYKKQFGFKFVGIPEITIKTSSILIESILRKMYSDSTYDINELYTQNISREYNNGNEKGFLDLKKPIEKMNELMNDYYNFKRHEMIHFRSINNDNILLLELQDIIFEFFNPVKLEEKKLLLAVLNSYFPIEGFATTLAHIIQVGNITKNSLIELMNFSSGQKILSISLLGLIMYSSDHSLILIDEPEMLLHPPMVKQYIQSINLIAKEKNSICILTTHSPIVIQELPNKCVYRIINGKLEQFETQTFGEDLVTLYQTVYDLESSLNGYANIVSKDKLKEVEIKQLGRYAYIDWLVRNEKS